MLFIRWFYSKHLFLWSKGLLIGDEQCIQLNDKYEDKVINQ